MKKQLYLAAAALAAFVMTSCDDNDNENQLPNLPGAPTAAHGVYVLTEGNFYNGIEGGLNVINFDTQKVNQNVFKTTNGRSLGDTPQCGVAYGSKVYIGTSVSNTIEIIDRVSWKSIKQIKVGDVMEGGQPYSMIAHDGKVFISMFGGNLARLDTTTMNIEKSVAVGNNPDQIALYKGKIYVPISDGMNWPNYGKTAVVVDPTTMQIEKTFETGLNPRQFLVADNHLYVLCMGDYGSVPSILYEVKSDYTLTEICKATIATPFGKKVAVINQPFTEGEPIVEYKTYTPSSGELADWDVERPDYANNMFYNEASGQLLISSYIMAGQYPSYDLPGYVNVYKTDGKSVDHRYNLGSGGRACMFTLKK